LANLLSKKKKAFTLAETLIALVIIGVVSALTLPTLLTKINDTVTKNKIAVFERKLSKGTDLLNIEYGIGPYYNGANPSYEFAQALSKHLKIVTICDKDNLTDCLPYSRIKTDEEDVEVSNIKDGGDFHVNKDDYTDVAGIVLGDGTPMILSWNKNCPVSDPDAVEYNGVKEDARSKTTSCIKGIVDLNGTKGPNKFGKDVIGFNGANLEWISFAGLKITKPEVPTPLYRDDYCTNNNGTWEVKSDYKTKYNIKYCCTNNSCITKGDRWAGAMVKCKDMGGHLATLTDLAKIATYLYDAPSQIGDTARYDGTLNTSKLGTTFAGLGSSWNYALWSSSEDSANYDGANGRYFNSSYTSRYNTYRYGSFLTAVCVK
ncbi:type II secretion system protein, partial [bacterium]|nr:type II secretion system protein [bacterium]